MYYVYLLKSKKTEEIYIGFTTDLQKRFYDHNKGLNKSTKHGIPWELIYYEAYKDRRKALEREEKLKYYGQALGRLKERIGL